MNPSRLFATLSQALLLALASQLPTLAASDEPYIPRRGKTLQGFVPPGYEIGVEVRGDFDGDGREDMAALLWVSPDSTNARPLIILLGQSDGTFRLSARTDRFTITEEDGCGAGNNYCVPTLQAKRRALVIGLASGTAAGYQVSEYDFRNIRSVWYQVRHANYGSGLELTCPESTPVRKDERCIEQGISKNLQTGIATRYCKFVDDDGKQTRIFRTTSTFSRTPLKRLTETEWESIEQ